MLGARNSVRYCKHNSEKKKIYKVPTLIEFRGRYVNKK